MKDYKVWKIIKIQDKPEDKTLVKNKWVFEIKRSGRFRARLVACGYSQIPGTDFTESHSPVINEVTVRILIIFEMVYKMKSKLVDIETAFLHGEFNQGEEVYMLIPEGLKAKDDECLELLKTIYGLVQAARAFFLKLGEVLKKIGFTQSAADPCLFIKRDKFGTVFMATWVDDSYCLGNEEALREMIKALEGFFTLKIEEDTKDF